MVKGIIDAFELCLVENLKKVVTELFHGHQYMLLDMLVLLLPFILSTKKLISNIALCTMNNATITSQLNKLRYCRSWPNHFIMLIPGIKGKKTNMS